MKNDAPHDVATHLLDDPDKYLTKVGKILRKTSLDEIPQLINIIVGDMSFVGPRPITKREIKANFTKTEQEILTSVRPGLTGMWQVYGRAEETWASGNRKKYDLQAKQLTDTENREKC